MSGLIPAIPLIIIRPFLPESPSWAKKRAAARCSARASANCSRRNFARTTIVTTIMFTCSFAAAFGAIQQMPQIVPGLPEVQAEIKEAMGKGVPEPSGEAALTRSHEAPRGATKPPWLRRWRPRRPRSPAK